MAVPTTRVMWASRHVPNPAQLEALQRIIGSFEIKHYPAIHQDGDALALRLKDWFCDEIVLVSKQEVFCSLTKKGFHPLRPVGYYGIDGVNIPVRDDKYFTFIGYQRVTCAKFELASFHISYKERPASILYWGSERDCAAKEWLRKCFGKNLKIYSISRSDKVMNAAAKYKPAYLVLPFSVPLWTIAKWKKLLPETTLLFPHLGEPNSHSPLVRDSRGNLLSFFGYKKVQTAEWSAASYY